jgi:hypothetical protein
MKRNQIILVLSLMLLGFAGMASPNLSARAATPAPSDQTDVRAAVTRIFDQLKTGQYAALYDALPSSSRSRLSRERFVEGLQRSRNLYQLERLEIGAVRVAGDLAVVDTIMYARIAKPFDTEGKLVAQQYVVREDGTWRVATGDNATINRFLKNNPAFAKKFPVKRTRAFIKQNGKWVEFNLSGRK